MDQFVLAFLYFPEDKSGYIPAAFEFAGLILLCFLAFFLIKRISKKQEMKAKELEERILRETKQNAEKKSEQ